MKTEEIKWLTLKQIKAAAKRSKKAAFKCSLLHWEQLASATPGQLKAALAMPRRTGIFANQCAMCRRYLRRLRGNDNCSACPIKCKSLWYLTFLALKNWEGSSGNYWSYLHDCICDMRDYLRREYRKCYPNG